MNAYTYIIIAGCVAIIALLAFWIRSLLDQLKQLPQPSTPGATKGTAPTAPNPTPHRLKKIYLDLEERSRRMNDNFSKSRRKTRMGLRNFIFFPLVLLLLFTVFWILAKIWAVSVWIIGLFQTISFDLISHWWKVVIVGLVLVAIFDLFFFKRTEEGGLKKHWGELRSKFYFGLLWAAIIGFINLMLRHLDVKAWWDLWTYKGEGSWFFWTLMAVFTISMVLIVNVASQKIRSCGFILFALSCIFSGIAINSTREMGAQALRTVPSGRHLQANTWTPFDVRDMPRMRLVTPQGIPFKVRINDDPTEIDSGPNGELVHLPPNRYVEVFWIKPARDMHNVRVYNNPNGS